MNYSVDYLKQVADCDVLLTWAENEKAELVFKKLSEDRLTAKFANTSVGVDAVLQGVMAELAAIDTILEVLPEGPTREAEVKKRVKLEYKKFLLETRKESYGAVALLEKQLDASRLDKEITEVEIFIQAIKAKKETF